MLEYRRIVAADVGQVAMLARRAAESAGDVPAHIDMGKIRGAVTFFAETPGHFQMAAFRDGKVVAAVAALAAEMPFFERMEAQVFMCFSTEPGACIRLLRALIAWFRQDFRLRRIVWAMNDNFDVRIRHLARRLGFQSEAPIFVLYK